MIASLTSYSLGDFLMFSQSALAATISTYNLSIWPWQFLFFDLLLLGCFFLWRSGSCQVLLASLVAGWIFQAFTFYGSGGLLPSLFWAAVYLQYALLLQASLCLVLFLTELYSRQQNTDTDSPSSVKSQHNRNGLYAVSLLIAGLLPYTVLLESELHWRQYTVFGTGTVATALVNIGIVQALRTRGLARHLIWPVPVILLCLGLVTLAAKA